MKQPKPNQTRHFCTFWLDDMCFGIDVLTVQEVIRNHELTPVPLASDVVKGLMNLRGQIITVVDLRRRMGLNPAGAWRKQMQIVVNVNGEPVSLIVDSIGEVVDVSCKLFEPPPGNVTLEAQELISGAYKLETVLLLELDTELALSDLAAAGAGPERRSA